MEAGAEPPNLPSLVKYSSERATNEDFSRAETCSTSNSDVIADPVNDPFDISLPDQSNATTPENAQVSPGLSPDTIGISVSEGYHSLTSWTKRKSSVVISCKKVMKSSNGVRVGAYQDESISIPTIQLISVITSVDELCMPPRLNLYESGLRQSARICELYQQEKYSKRKNSHVTYHAATI